MASQKISRNDPAIIIDGKRISLKPERLDVHDDVKLDADNPRIRYLVKSHNLKNPSQDQLFGLLWEVSGVQSLMTKIRNNKGAIDPILVTQDDIVIEGNCRLACYRHLNKGKDGAHFKTIDVYRLPKITQLEIDILLSKYHVSGKISWRSYAQAGQIHKLKHDHNLKVEQITATTGIREKDVRDLLKTYEIMTGHVLPNSPGKKGLRKFSHIYEYVKNPDPDLVAYRKGTYNDKEFAKLVTDGKIKRGSDVRKFPDVLRDAQALKTLKRENDGGKKAFAMVVRAQEFATLEKAKLVMEGMNSSLIEVLKKDKREQGIVRDLYTKARELAGIAGIGLK